METGLKELIDAKRKEGWRKDWQDKISDEEVLGVLISQHFEWDGKAIFDVATSGFEDSNFDTFNKKFGELWKKEMEQYEKATSE